MPEATINADLKNAVEAMASGGYIPHEAKYTRQVVAMGAATALTLRAVEDSAVMVHALTDNSVVTLPLTTTCKGMQVTVRNVGADGAAKVSISPNAADKIKGSVAGKTGAGAAAVVQASGTANKDWINTKSTANQGDFTTLVSDGVDTWWITEGVGEWASE